MSLITELNLSFSDIEHETAPRKQRAMKTTRQLASYHQQRDVIPRLPQLVPPQHHKGSSPRLGIKGVGKTQGRESKDSITQELYHDNEPAHKSTDKQRKRKQKRVRKRAIVKAEFEGTREKNDISLPQIESKSFVKGNSDSYDKSDKTIMELAEYFRSFQDVNGLDAGQYRGLHGHFFSDNSPASADLLLSQVIEQDKKEQMKAARQLEKSVLRGQAVTKSRHEVKTPRSGGRGL